MNSPVEFSAQNPSSRPGVRDSGYVNTEKAELLYRHGWGGILVSAATSTFLVLTLQSSLPLTGGLLWWAAMLLILGARVAMLVRWSRRGLADRSGIEDLRFFLISVSVTALVWAAFPILFFDSLNLVDRAIMAIVLAGMAGGSTMVLAFLAAANSPRVPR